MIPQILAGPQRPVPRRYDLTFLDSTVVTPTAMTFRFSTEGTDFHYRSNQAVRLVPPGVEDPWGPERSFSLSSSPSEMGFIAVTCKMTGSAYKEGLKRLKRGDHVQVLDPVGDLFYNGERPAVMIAGGIGITPFRGMVRYATDLHMAQPIRLLCSARTPEEFAFREELARLAQVNPHVEILYTVTRPTDSTTRWEGRVGRIDVPWVREATRGLDHPKYYVVGLPQMADEMVEALRSEVGIPEEDLEYEYFGGY